MLKIIKRSGKEEEFSTKKLEKSIRCAGGSDKSSREIAEGTKHRAGIKTSDVRTRTIGELKRLGPEAGKRYESYKKKSEVKK